MTTAEPVLIHATAVSIGDLGVLISGPSGSGKSDLTLRLIDRGARLVADDCCLLSNRGGKLVATVPAAIAGLIEVRNIGLMHQPAHAEAVIALHVALGNASEDAPGTARYCGLTIPSLRLISRHASTPIKVELALRSLGSARSPGPTD